MRWLQYTKCTRTIDLDARLPGFAVKDLFSRHHPSCAPLRGRLMHLKTGAKAIRIKEGALYSAPYTCERECRERANDLASVTLYSAKGGKSGCWKRTAGRPATLSPSAATFSFSSGAARHARSLGD